MTLKHKIVAFFMILAALMPCFDASARRYRKKDAVFRVDIRQDEKLRTDFQQPLALMSCSGLKYDLEARLRSYVAFLAGDELEGRAMGSAGSSAAAFFISGFFRNAGLEVKVNTFSSAGHTGRNILGMKRYPGANRYVVVMASYDGLGRLGGKIYPCADANASGVAALLELASDVHKPVGRPKNFIYVALDGHNVGMSGGEALVNYLASQGINPSSIAMVINLDTMGSTLVPPSGSGKDYLIALGGGQMAYSMMYSNTGLNLDLSYDYYGSKGFTEMFYSRVSEQKHFLALGVPCVMFTSGITDHTFKTTDTAATLDYPVFARRVEFIRRWMRRF